MKLNSKGITGIIVLIFLCFHTFSDESVDIESIVKKADSYLEWEKVYSTSELTVFKSGNPQPAMKVESFSLLEDGKSYSLTIYRAPAKMKGTAYLMIENDIWVKFGNTGRIRKLSSSAKKNSAGGTDFSYNDMSNNNTGLSKLYAITLLNEKEKVNDDLCYKVQFTALPDSDTPYEQLIAYITRKNNQYIKIEYYENNANIKTLTLNDFREIGGRSYPFLIRMDSHTKESYTEYKILSIEFQSPLVKKQLFTQPYLEQIK
ncbi:MAG: outer membrane lipoprotein-sorting protein [Spirochaetales bacterium]|nr:outer membrane lipoprotein-sorting protein [Spirochaetales bacterium]